MRSKVLIIGCGYVGQHLAHALRAQHSVLAVVRTEKSRDALRASGIEAEAVDLDTVTADSWPLSAQQVDGSWLFYLAPPPSEGESDLRFDVFQRRIKGLPSVLVYMSTTGVYGNRSGGDVDESTQVEPQTERATRRMSAEHMTRVWCNERGVRRVVLRVPGIYGRGRIALSRLQRGEPFVRVAEAGINNRIHVYDLVAACIAVAQKSDARGVYNVTDGNAMSSTEFMQHVAAIAGLPPPVEISLEEARQEFSAERMSFLNESRRVSNRRLLSDLGLTLRYANIDEGIRASL